ncbi:hypothetical protein Tco_0987233 [Tanacetum coccineum]
MAPWNQPSFLWSRSPPRQKHYGTLLPAPLRVLHVDTSSSSKPSSSHLQKDLSLPLPLPPFRGSLTLAHPITSLKISPTSPCTSHMTRLKKFARPQRNRSRPLRYANGDLDDSDSYHPNKKMKKKKKIKVTPKKKVDEYTPPYLYTPGHKCSGQVFSLEVLGDDTQEMLAIEFVGETIGR